MNSSTTGKFFGKTEFYRVCGKCHFPFIYLYTTVEFGLLRSKLDEFTLFCYTGELNPNSPKPIGVQCIIGIP